MQDKSSASKGAVSLCLHVGFYGAKGVPAGAIASPKPLILLDTVDTMSLGGDGVAFAPSSNP
jgi:hypothetical protein